MSTRGQTLVAFFQAELTRIVFGTKNAKAAKNAKKGGFAVFAVFAFIVRCRDGVAAPLLRRMPSPSTHAGIVRPNSVPGSAGLHADRGVPRVRARQPPHGHDLACGMGDGRRGAAHGARGRLFSAHETSSRSRGAAGGGNGPAHHP